MGVCITEYSTGQGSGRAVGGTKKKSLLDRWMGQGRPASLGPCRRFSWPRRPCRRPRLHKTALGWLGLVAAQRLSVEAGVRSSCGIGALEATSITLTPPLARYVPGSRAAVRAGQCALQRILCLLAHIARWKELQRRMDTGRAPPTPPHRGSICRAKRAATVRELQFLGTPAI